MEMKYFYAGSPCTNGLDQRHS